MMSTNPSDWNATIFGIAGRGARKEKIAELDQIVREARKKPKGIAGQAENPF